MRHASPCRFRDGELVAYGATYFLLVELLPHQLKLVSSPRLYYRHMYRSFDEGCMFVYFEQKLIIVLILQTVNVISGIN